ncbi:MAG TPA: TadE family protein [Candidatus Binatia bacterium]|nr:TadE family protein [Candidatus Binatia bacterium]
MVEFALVAPVFFFLLFSIMNAGLFLYARNAIQHAADLGVAAIAAEGRCSGAGGICAANPLNCPTGNPSNVADEVGICRMDNAGLTTTALVTVTEIDVWRIQQTLTPGQPSVTVSTCDANGNNPGSGSQPCNDVNDPSLCGGPCEDIYQANGSVVSEPWPATSRDASTNEGPDFVRLVIKYEYTAFGAGFQFSLTTSNVFRLEPET